MSQVVAGPATQPPPTVVVGPPVGRSVEVSPYLVHWALGGGSALSVLVGWWSLVTVAPVRAGDIAGRQAAFAFAGLTVAWVVHGLYRPAPFFLRPEVRWRMSTIAVCLPTAAVVALALDAASGARLLTLTGAVAMTAPAVVIAPTLRAVAGRASSRRHPTRVLLVGSGEVALRVAARLRRSGARVVGFVDDGAAPGGSTPPVMGGLADLPELCRLHAVDRVVVAYSTAPESEVVAHLRELRVPISVVPRFFELHSWRSRIEELDGLPLVHVAPAQAGRLALFAKRLLDVGVSSAALVVLAVPATAVALAVRLESRGPALFWQRRSGRDGRAFLICKFRTMHLDADGARPSMDGVNEADGPLFKMRDDPRVTRIGRLLRRTSIDELPQLWNVLKGEMSLVGPRPLPVDQAEQLSGPAAVRTEVRPGMTGLWQVSGRSDLGFADLVHLDAAYVRSWSFAWDLRIIVATPRSILRRHGAY